MSEESRFIESTGNRLIRPEERALAMAMLSGKYDHEDLERKLAASRVEDMQDGGMGSIRFVTEDQRKRALGKSLAEAEYIDEDGTPVSILISADDKGDVYEIDFWKVDFSPLKRYPAVSDLRVKR
jgi:hypothetical protein